MARSDGVDRTSARNVNLSAGQIGNVQRHNEREKESYTNPDIIPERTTLNVHYKEPDGDYTVLFEQMKKDGKISTRGLKDDANLYGELIFDVNSAYFHNHGGYEFAKQFYADAYKAAVKIVGGEDYILSAVMHADERNRAMSEALGKDVFHYHLHVVYIPVVEKKILWTKRCKDPKLVGTVKETVMQVSSSKKWKSRPALDEQGKPILQKSGKPVLRKSYTVLQDDFFQMMRDAGYNDVERGERGSSEEHLTVTQFKVEQEQQRLAQLEQQVEEKTDELQAVKKETKTQKSMAATFDDIDKMGKKSVFGKILFSEEEAASLKKMAKRGVKADAVIASWKEKYATAQKDAGVWKKRYQDLYDETKDFLVVIREQPEQLKALKAELLHPAYKPRFSQKEQAR